MMHDRVKHPSELDINEYAQDINDPVWPSEPVEPAVGSMPTGHQHDGLRTLHGMLDLMLHVKDETDDYAEHGMEGSVAHRPPRTRDTPIIVETFERATTSWRGTNYQVSQMDTRIVVERNDRKRVVITNYSTGTVYLSHETSTSPGTLPGGNFLTLAAGASRELRTTGEVYAHPAVIGTAQSIDVQDEYGYPKGY